MIASGKFVTNRLNPIRRVSRPSVIDGIGWEFCSILIGCLLLVFAILKENPMFWRNAGGYPIWLRQMVLVTFYPALIVQIPLLLSHSWSVLKHRRIAGSPRWFVTAAIGLPWLLLFITVLIVVGNNLENWMEGRSFHWHAAI